MDREKDGSARVEQTIFVTRESQRKIVLGARAARPSRRSARRPRKEIAEAADTKVHLFLHVKVRENWIDDPARYREMGLEFPKESTSHTRTVDLRRGME